MVKKKLCIWGPLPIVNLSFFQQPEEYKPIVVSWLCLSELSIFDATRALAQWCIKILMLLLSCKVAFPVWPVAWECCWFSVIVTIIYSKTVFSLSCLGAMQTPEAGADSTSTVPLQTTVPVQPTGSNQQVPVQQQVQPASLSVGVFVSECSWTSVHAGFLSAICDLCQLNN